MFFLPGELVLDKTDLEIKTYQWLHRKCSSLFIKHVFQWIEALCLMDGRFVVLFNKCGQCHLRIIKPINLLNSVFQFYLKFEISWSLSHFC